MFWGVCVLFSLWTLNCASIPWDPPRGGVVLLKLVGCIGYKVWRLDSDYLALQPKLRNLLAGT